MLEKEAIVTLLLQTQTMTTTNDDDKRKKKKKKHMTEKKIKLTAFKNDISNHNLDINCTSKYWSGE